MAILERFSYVSPNKKYTAFAHFASHDITSQENEV